MTPDRKFFVTITENARELAAEGVTRSSRVESLLLQAVAPALQRSADLAFLRSRHTARYTFGPDLVVSSATGGWHERIGVAPEAFVGGRIDAWPTWRHLQRAVSILMAEPWRRTVSWFASSKPGAEDRWFSALTRTADGWALVCYELEPGKSFLGDLDE